MNIAAAASRGKPTLPVLASDCCTPLPGEPLTAQPLTARQAADLAGVLKALADPARLRILSLVAAREGGEICTCELTGPLGLTQPTISHHVKILVDAGILTGDKRGKWTYYTLNRPALDALSAVPGASDPRVSATGQ